MTFAENFKIVEALPPAADAAGRGGDWISLKGANSVSVVVSVTQGNAAVVPITIEQATTVGGAGGKPITKAVPIWSNLDTAASDTLVKRTSAVSYSTDAGVKNKQVVFHIDPATLDIQGGFDCIRVVTAASNAGNITQATYIIESRYGTGQSAITD